MTNYQNKFETLPDVMFDVFKLREEECIGLTLCCLLFPPQCSFYTTPQQPLCSQRHHLPLDLCLQVPRRHKFHLHQLSVNLIWTCKYTVSPPTLSPPYVKGVDKFVRVCGLGLQCGASNKDHASACTILRNTQGLNVLNVYIHMQM